MIRSIIPPLLLLLSSPLLAQNDPSPDDLYGWVPPQGCKERRVYGGTVSGCVGVCEDGSGENDIDYLKAESKKFIAIDLPTTVKGDGAPLLSSGDEIHFFDSLGGYRGKNSANTEGNAYLTFDVTEKRRFDPMEGWVWVMKNLGDYHPWCSMKKVYFHTAPKISFSVTNEEQVGDRIEGKINMYGSQDTIYSKNAIDGLATVYQVQRKLISRWTGQFCDVVEEYSDWVNVLNNSTNNSFTYGLLDCEVQYRMRNFDGTYYSQWATVMIRNNRSQQGGGSSSSSSGGGSGSSSSGGGHCSGSRCDIEP